MTARESAPVQFVIHTRLNTSLYTIPRFRLPSQKLRMVVWFFGRSLHSSQNSAYPRFKKSIDLLYKHLRTHTVLRRGTVNTRWGKNTPTADSETTATLFHPIDHYGEVFRKDHRIPKCKNGTYGMCFVSGEFRGSSEMNIIPKDLS